MRRYTYNVTQDGDNPQAMRPWGCIGRTLLFLLALAILIILLSFFRSCDRGSETENGLLPPSQPIELPADSIIDIPDNAPIPGDNQPLPDNNIENPGPNLPAPADNYIPPVNDDEIVEDPETGRQMVDDRINVILDSDAGDETFRRWADEFKQNYPDDDHRILFYDPLTKLIQLQVPRGTCDRVIRELPQKISDIPFKAFREGMMGGLEAWRPNDPAFQNAEYSWYFAPIQAFEAWEITQGSPDITVAIVDSYFDLRHPDLYSDRIVSPFSVKRRNRNVAPEPGLPTDVPAYFHGSCVASMALANINNGNGAAGIAPACKFMPVSMGHQFTMMTVMYGLLYSIYQGANVINISAGLNLPEQAKFMPIEQQVEIANNTGIDEADVWDYVFDMAEERGVTIVWATGNNNILASIDPSKRGATTIRVSALDTQLSMASFSNFGNLPQYGQACSTVSAPGVDIIGAIPGGGYSLGPGTSYSAPIVTGAVALIKSLDPTLSSREIIDILVETGRPIADSPEIGPMIQIRDALERVRGNMASADDILDNHDMLTGIWKTTAMFKVLNADTKEWTGEYTYVYFDFSTPDSGTIAYHEGNSAEPCGKAPVTVNWDSTPIIVEHTQAAGAFVPSKFTIKKGNDNLLEITKVNRPDNEKFYLKRIDRMPC